MTRGAQVSEDEVRRAIEVIHECLGEGFPPNPSSTTRGAVREAAERMGISRQTMENRLATGARKYGLKWNEAFYRPKAGAPIFEVDGLPDDGEPDAETLIALLKDRHGRRKALEDAQRLQTVRVGVDGPIGIAFFGDTHVDDPGCAWGDLERDVKACRDTHGMMAVGVGDHRNNWIGRLMALYADQEITSKQSLMLVEWLFTQLPWLLNIGGNHDKWGSEHGDAVEIMHKMRAISGLYENDGARLRLVLPAGAELTMHVRHDFPGHSQFNGAHAMVRETLFGYRDHIMACGHRHSTAYMPVWHNDPVRLCHGLRCGAYKDMDKYAKTKHFKQENWARSLAVTVDPEYAHDPVRYIKPWFSLEEAAEYLTWRRNKWGSQKSAA
jgi:hypothetical protein